MLEAVRSRCCPSREVGRATTAPRGWGSGSHGDVLTLMSAQLGSVDTGGDSVRCPPCYRSAPDVFGTRGSTTASLPQRTSLHSLLPAREGPLMHTGIVANRSFALLRAALLLPLLAMPTLPAAA